MLHCFFLQNIRNKSYGSDMQAVHHSALAEPAKYFVTITF